MDRPLAWQRRTPTIYGVTSCQIAEGASARTDNDRRRLLMSLPSNAVFVASFLMMKLLFFGAGRKSHCCFVSPLQRACMGANVFVPLAVATSKHIPVMALTIEKRLPCVLNLQN